MTHESSLSTPARVNHPRASVESPWPIRIHALGGFEVQVEGQVLPTEGKTWGKPLTLLRMLVMHGGRSVRIGKLIAALWPSQGGNTRGVFDVTLLRLRKLLRSPDALLIRHGELALSPRNCWLDLWHFERYSPPQYIEVDGVAISALKSYRGTFLPMDADNPGSFAIRERLRTHFHAAVLHVGTHLQHSGDWKQALQIYHHATQADPLEEEYYYRQMLCQVELGQLSDARDTYDRCRQRIGEAFNASPTARLTRLLEHGTRRRLADDSRGCLTAYGSSARTPADPGSGWPWPVSIRALGQFSVTVKGTAQGIASGGQRRPLDILRALVALGGLAVPLPTLIDAVWDSEERPPRGAFDTALLRLRKLLPRDDAVKLDGGKVTLNPDVCWVDVWEFDRAATRFLIDHVSAEAEQALSLYRGSLLGSMDGPRWAAGMRERLSLKFRQIITTLGDLYESARDWEGAARIYQRGVAVDGGIEDFYRRLIHCHWRMGYQIDAIRVYHRCRDALQAVSQRSPSAATTALYQQILDSPMPVSS